MFVHKSCYKNYCISNFIGIFLVTMFGGRGGGLRGINPGWQQQRAPPLAQGQACHRLDSCFAHTVNASTMRGPSVAQHNA